MKNFWNHLRITHRFMVVLGAFVLCVLVMAGIGLSGLALARDGMQNLYQGAMVRSQMSEQIVSLQADTRMQVLLAFQHDPEGSLFAAHDHDLREHLDAIANNQASAGEIHKSLVADTQDPEELALLDGAAQARAAWRPKVQSAVEALENGNFSAQVMNDFLIAARNEGANVVMAMEMLRTHQLMQAHAYYSQSEERYRWALWVFGGAALLLLLPSLLLALALLQRLKKGFQTAGRALEHIADSDLSRTVSHDGTDEIGSMLLHMERMRTRLAQTVGRVKAGTVAIAGASAQVAAGAQDLSGRTEQQASALEQTASATEELSSTVQHNADNAVQASQLAGEARRAVQAGGDIVGEMVQTMAAIDQSAHKIVDIIGVIDGIAFQTNILALNAAVEAARAGEQGRGFAVVAGEVRSLAQRSAEAAREVQRLITDAVSKAETGNQQAAQAGTAMQNILGGIQRVTSIVDEIATASREQATGLAQINQAVGHLDGVTQQNAALVEETSAASSALQQQASSLAALADTFRLAEQAGAADPVMALA